MRVCVCVCACANEIFITNVLHSLLYQSEMTDESPKYAVLVLKRRTLI